MANLNGKPTASELAAILRELCDELAEDHEARLAEIRNLADAIEALAAGQSNDEKWLLYPLPVEFPVTSEFGDGAIKERPTIHEGIDFGCPIGVNVMAAAGGVVVSAHYNAAYGYRAQVEHEHRGEAWFTWYCHLSTLRVVAGQSVIAGQSIGMSGATGNVTGPHLHFNVQREYDKFLIYGLPEILRGCVNPRLYVKFPMSIDKERL